MYREFWISRKTLYVGWLLGKKRKCHDPLACIATGGKGTGQVKTIGQLCATSLPSRLASQKIHPWNGPWCEHMDCRSIHDHSVSQLLPKASLLHPTVCTKGMDEDRIHDTSTEIKGFISITWENAKGLRFDPERKHCAPLSWCSWLSRSPHILLLLLCMTHICVVQFTGFCSKECRMALGAMPGRSSSVARPSLGSDYDSLAQGHGAVHEAASSTRDFGTELPQLQCLSIQHVQLVFRG